jgi:hypothetical protein
MHNYIKDIDDVLTFYAPTHDPTTKTRAVPDSAPTYRIYEQETGTAIANGSMDLIDVANNVSAYSEQITLSAANGYELGKDYAIVIKAVFGSITQQIIHHLSMTRISAVQMAALITAGNALLATKANVAILREGTLQGMPTATTATLDAGAAFGTNALRGATLVVTSSTLGYSQSILIQSNTNSAGANLVSFDAFQVTPTGTLTYQIIGTPPAPIGAPIGVSVTHWLGVAVQTLGTMTSGSIAGEFGLIINKTTNLPTDPADQSLVIAATDAIMTTLGTMNTSLGTTPAGVLAAFEASPNYQIILAGVNGDFAYNPTTQIQILKDKGGSDIKATHNLTIIDGIIVNREST